MRKTLAYFLILAAGVLLGMVWHLVAFLVVMACTLLLAAEVVGQAPVAPEPPIAAWQPSEVDAVGWAFSALMSYSEADRPYVRFVWIPPWGDAEWIGVIDFAVNAACSQTRVLHRADRHAGGWLLAYRLNVLAPEPAKLAKLVETWDGIADQDPHFHLPEVNLDRKGVVLAPHLQAALARHVTNPAKDERIDVLVTQLTKSTGAIYRADFLLEQLLTSVRGKYPEFRQMEFKTEKFTPLQTLLRSRGYFFEQSQDFRGDKGALLLTSDVTGKSRLVFTAFGLASGVPLVSTFDFKDNRTRPDQQFIRNLIDFEELSDASEIFVPLPNGLVEYVLADAKGNLQRAAPPDVVADFTKPDGHTKELEAGMSCWLCHAPDNGYKTAKNDMEFLLGSDTDFFGDDLTYKGKPISSTEAVAIVAGRFGERIDEPDGILGRARRDFDRAISRLTDYKVTADGPTATQRLGAKTKEIYHQWRYRKIDADRACLELGLRVPAGRGRGYLRSIVPPPAAGQREDVVIALLRNGAEIKRDDLNAIHGEMARRVVRYRERARAK